MHSNLVIFKGSISQTQAKREKEDINKKLHLKGYVRRDVNGVGMMDTRPASA